MNAPLSHDEAKAFFDGLSKRIAREKNERAERGETLPDLPTPDPRAKQRPQRKPAPMPMPPVKPVDGERYQEGDDALAASDVRVSMILAEAMAGRFLFEHGSNRWRTYRGGRWDECTVGEDIEEAKLLGPAMLREAATIAATEPDAAARLTRLAMRAMSSAGVGAALKLAQSDPRLAAHTSEFDQDPDLLNVANGVIYLPTGELRPHDPALRITKQSPVEYLPRAAAPQWLKFLDEISCNDPDWVDYLRRALAYTLSGRVDQEKFFFMLGGGANGKSVLVNLMQHILGPYETSVPPSFLEELRNKDGEAASPVKASLQGKRMALANEVRAGSTLSEQVVKEICSNDAIAARRLYGDTFSFRPTHKLWVRANNRPIVKDTDDGIWRRFDLIPFDRKFEGHEKDTRLGDKLKAEAAGVLAWLVAGYAEYAARGLQPCARVAAASAAYRRESDVFLQWLTDETMQGPTEACEQKRAYGSYRDWCDENGHRSWSKKSFTTELLKRGFSESKSGHLRNYRGFNLCADNRPF
ncbi:putative DNA primase/helicase [Bradyrhizobium sp. USDA 377]